MADTGEYKTWTLHWLGSAKRTEDVTGRTIAEAMNHAGIGQGALAALDYYEEKAVADD